MNCEYGVFIALCSFIFAKCEMGKVFNCAKGLT